MWGLALEIRGLEGRFFVLRCYGRVSLRGSASSD
jgi:hypothetical protein